jgi:hypothetical protein
MRKAIVLPHPHYLTVQAVIKETRYLREIQFEGDTVPPEL